MKNLFKITIIKINYKNQYINQYKINKNSIKKSIWKINIRINFKKINMKIKYKNSILKNQYKNQFIKINININHKNQL